MKESEFSKMKKQLAQARSKKENAIGKGGFEIELKDPDSFQNTMRVIVMTNPKNEEKI